MKTVDEDLWHQQAAELQEDKVGKEFLAFLTEWVETAERAMDVNDNLAPSSAIRSSLLAVEERRGRISASFVGQMLVVIISHWIHGHQLSAEFTAIERRLMEDMLILKLQELRDSAQDTGTEVLEEVQP